MQTSVFCGEHVTQKHGSEVQLAVTRHRDDVIPDAPRLGDPQGLSSQGLVGPSFGQQVVLHANEVCG